MTGDSRQPFIKCNYCEKTFPKKSRKNCNRHMKNVHLKNAAGDDLPPPQLFCVLCEKPFAYKQTLQRHINSVHLEKEVFSCSLCKYSTNQKHNLLRHRKIVHDNKDSRANKAQFTCAHCRKQYVKKINLRGHERYMHGIIRGVRPKTLRQCPLCPFSSSKKAKEEIHDHFGQVHNIITRWETYQFASYDQFLEWKNYIEMKTKASFSKRISSNNSVHFVCNRTGSYKARGCGKRRLKRIGSCKMNAYCPCTIRARTHDSGSVSVSYLPTHIGHQSELKFLRLKAEDKKSVAAQLLCKTTHEEILKGIQQSLCTGDGLRRIHLLTKKDIINIEKSLDLNASIERNPYNPNVSIEGWAEELRDDTDTELFHYKPQGVVDPQFPQLKKEDFVLILMTRGQKTLLKSWGRHSVCIDGTPGPTSGEFQIYSILALDDTRQGFPCAFMFTNKADESMLSLFFQAVKDSTGPIFTNVFMSDMNEISYPAWSKAMGPARSNLFCAWYVLKELREHLTKIKNKKKRDEVFKMIKTLLYELDVDTFKKLLSESLLQLENDVTTVDFYNYFNYHYVHKERYKMWAYCYRTHAGVNTNMSIENYNKVLKFCYLQRKNIPGLDRALHAILNLIRDKLFDYIFKLEKAKVITKLRILRKRHETSLLIDSTCILTDNSGKWQVLSSNVDEFYTVQKVKDCQKCELQCFECRSCFHEFMCTCTDSALKNNMCEHIHAVANSLPYSEEIAVNDEGDQQMNLGHSDHLVEVEETVVSEPHHYTEEVICDEGNLQVEVEHGDRQIEEALIFEQSTTSCDYNDKMRNEVEGLFEEVMKEATSSHQLKFVQKHMKETLSVIKDMNLTTNPPIQIIDPHTVKEVNYTNNNPFTSDHLYSTERWTID